MKIAWQPRVGYVNKRFDQVLDRPSSLQPVIPIVNTCNIKIPNLKRLGSSLGLWF